MASVFDVLRVGLLSLISVMVGCSSNVDLIGHCTLDGDPVLLALPMGTPSVAVVGERMFVSVTRSTTSFPQPSGSPGGEAFGAWIAQNGSLVSGVIDFGASIYDGLHRTKWTRTRDGGLVGLIAFDPARDRSTNIERFLHRWYINADSVIAPRQMAIDVSAAEGGVENGWIPYLGVYFNDTGVDTIWPSADIGGIQYSAFVEHPVGTACASPLAAFVIGPDDIAVPVQTVDCTNLDRAVRTATGAPTLFDPGDGTIGALVRMGAADDVGLRLIRFRPDGTLVAPPRLVGQGHAQGTGGGLLARVARVPGNRLIVAERDAGENDCHMLTVMTRDGSESDPAPWQPPCVGTTGYTEGEARTAWVELVEVPGGAVFIWEEAPYVGLRLTDEDTWYEHINAVLLTPEGKRGSEIITVTAPQSTVVGPIGPYPGTYAQHFVGHADSDGNHVAVVWTDLRADAPGLYARHLRCAVDPE